jgi:LmbE family N-acetylglucosaminyl deacetylase
MKQLNASMFKDKDILFLSPHHDDMVLSCGGFIRSIRPYCGRFAVINVFTKSLWAPNAKGNLIEEDISSLRLSEDDDYCGIHHIESYNLGFKDSLIRGYDSISELNADINEDEIFYKVMKKLRKVIDALRYDYILGPMAIGGHIDHKMVLEAVMGHTKGTMILYEDIPYAYSCKGHEQIKEVGRSIGNMEARYCDITSSFIEKIDDIQIYKSQLEEGLLEKVRFCASRFNSGAYYERMWLKF